MRPRSPRGSIAWPPASRRCAGGAARRGDRAARGDLSFGPLRVPGRTNDETRKLLLDRAGLALVPFQAFGLSEDSGWFRISVGAVSLAEIDAALPRVRAALAGN